MLYLQKHFSLILCFMVISKIGFSQIPISYFPCDSIFIVELDRHKNITCCEEFEEPIKTALSHFPELNNTEITFKYQKNNSPLSTRIRLTSIFKNKRNRKYIIIISSQTKEMIKPIMFTCLSLNAQIGVLGHELSHVSEFNSKSFFYFVRHVFKQLFHRWIDKFEFNTDLRTIQHGLGYQLLSWSKEVRKNLKSENWGGSNNPQRDRYMNPNTIQMIIDTTTIYH